MLAEAACVAEPMRKRNENSSGDGLMEVRLLARWCINFFKMTGILTAQTERNSRSKQLTSVYWVQKQSLLIIRYLFFRW